MSPALGAGGRGFKSRQPDRKTAKSSHIMGYLLSSSYAILGYRWLARWLADGYERTSHGLR